jgi:hypothetical protein
MMNGSFIPFGGSDGAGIGSGYASGDVAAGGWPDEIEPSESTVDFLNLVNGTFVVTDGHSAAGIGSGFAEHGGRSMVGCLAVFGGSYNIAGGEDGGAIMGSDRGSGSGPEPEPTFNESQSKVSSLFIAGGDFHIQGGSNAAGIGSGRGSEKSSTGSGGRSNIDRLEIRNGSFRIAAGADESGIGAAGHGSFVTDLIILDGVFEITASNLGVCIGTAAAAVISSIVIQSGSYNLSGRVGIGVTGKSFVGAISIGANSGTVFLDCSSVSDRTCVNATGTYLGNSSINAIVAGERFLPFESESAEETELWIEYLNRSVREGITEIPSLHFGELDIPIDEQGIGNTQYSPLESFDESLAREGYFPQRGFLRRWNSALEERERMEKDQYRPLLNCLRDTAHVSFATGTQPVSRYASSMYE